MTHNLLNGTAAYIVEKTAHGFVVDTLDRIDAMINRERTGSDAREAEKQRALINRDEARSRLGFYDEQNSGKPVVQDIDPETGETVADPKVFDENGREKPGLSSHAGSDHARASTRLSLVRDVKKSDSEYLEISENAQSKSPYRGNSNSWGRHLQGVDKTLHTFDPHSTLIQFQPGKGTKASMPELEKLGEAALQIVREIAEVEQSSVPLSEVDAHIEDYCEVPIPFKLVLPDHRPRAANGQRRSLKVSWEQRALRGVEPSSGTIPVAHDIEAIALWLASDRIEKELKRQAKAAYSDEGRLTLSNEERKKRLTRLRKRLHETELLESWIMWALITEAGMDLVPRKGISPRALLQIF